MRTKSTVENCGSLATGGSTTDSSLVVDGGSQKNNSLGKEDSNMGEDEAEEIDEGKDNDTELVESDYEEYEGTEARDEMSEEDATK